MIQTYKNQSGQTFTSLPLQPLEIYTNDDLDHIYHGNIVTAANGEQFTVLDSKHIRGRVYRITLLPVAQEAQL